MDDSNTEQLNSLEPKRVWDFFSKISQIPRPSGQEQKVTDWLISLAKKHSLQYKLDSVGNFCLHIPASPEYINSPAVILQAHSDMITEKRPSKKHNFLTDPITLKVQNDWILADDTTLGADDGIGLALALAIATDQEIAKPALQILVTIEEETTFKGAINLDPETLGLNGSYYLNLDTEEVDTIYTASAGMTKLKARADLDRLGAYDLTKSYLKIKVANLPGGHSGCQIHEVFRENAILAVLNFISKFECNVVSLNGGNKDNAIPRDMQAIIEVSPEIAAKLTHDPHFTDQDNPIEIEVIDPTKLSIYPLGPEESRLLIHTFTNLKNGALSFRQDIGIVETSSNFASINTDPSTAEITIKISIRSFIDDHMGIIFNEHQKYLNLSNFTVTRERTTYGWNGDPNSELVTIAKEAYKHVVGQYPKVTAVHAGLEAGEITRKVTEYTGVPVQAISIGPTIEDPHTPDEKLYIPSVKVSYLQIIEILQKIANLT